MKRKFVLLTIGLCLMLAGCSSQTTNDMSGSLVDDTRPPSAENESGGSLSQTESSGNETYNDADDTGDTYLEVVELQRGQISIHDPVNFIAINGKRYTIMRLKKIFVF